MSETHARPAIAQAAISVILQAQALATETQQALQGWRQFLRTLQRPCEILLVQETRPEVPTPPAEQSPHDDIPVRTFFYERGLGHRDALNEAIRTAQHPLLVFSTCDLQYQPADLERMLKMIDLVDLIVGFRVGQPIPFWRLWLDTAIILLSRVLLGIPLAPTVCWPGPKGWGRRRLARWIFGLRVNDPECPFRLVRRTIFERLPLQSRGEFVQIEMLAKANHLACLIGEEPVTWTPPAHALPEGTSFAEDAWLVFHEPTFGRSAVAVTMPPAPESGTA